MTTTAQNAHPLSTLIRNNETQLGEEWLRSLKLSNIRSDGFSDEQLRKQCTQFLSALADAIRDGNLADIEARSYDEMRHVLGDISSSRARQGNSPSETATFVFSLKQALFGVLSRESTLLDKLGLHTIECTRNRATRSSCASSRNCWSCRPRWSSCGTASWRCR
jgi:rsbT co-antagonist protein RsbR